MCRLASCTAAQVRAGAGFEAAGGVAVAAWQAVAGMLVDGRAQCTCSWSHFPAFASLQWTWRSVR